MAETLSSMVPYGYQWNKCGYCGKKSAIRQNTSPSYYAQSESLTAEDYQILADRGWRRSGTTYYKPDLKNGCCPHYSIRLKADDFKPSSNQRAAVNAFNKYIIGPEYKRLAAGLCPKSRAEKRWRKQNFDVKSRVKDAEIINLQAPPDPKNENKPIKPAHTLEVTLETDEFTDEKYGLFEIYQRTVHKEPPSKISKESFKNFLCSGLRRRIDLSGKRLGSYHQCYRIDGELVAFGVLDLLPHAVSSVYVVYRDDVSHWQFGKLSALREIGLTLEGGYGWYYMGYYIHSCAKMKYKADYKPQYVLDISSLQWHVLNQAFWDALNRGKLATYNSHTETWEVSQSGGASGDGNNRPETIWDAKFVGVLPAEEVVEKLPLKDLPCQVLQHQINLEEILGKWDLHKITSGRSLQTVVAELVACVGIEFARQIAVDIEPYLAR